jgi:hypothetical protein
LLNLDVSSNARIVLILPLSSQVNLKEFPTMLAHENHHGDWQPISTNNQGSRIVYQHKQQKCQFNFFTLPNAYESTGNIEELLQLISIADSLLLVTEYQEDMVQPLIDEVKTLSFYHIYSSLMAFFFRWDGNI